MSNSYSNKNNSFPTFVIDTLIECPPYIKRKTYTKKIVKQDESNDNVPVNCEYNIITNVLTPSIPKPSTNNALATDNAPVTNNAHVTDNVDTLDSSEPFNLILPLTDDNAYIRLYRSIITDENMDILCYSPCTALPIDDFKNKYPSITPSIYANEIIEGTMINLFYDPRHQSWEISTRATIGCNYWYYRTQYTSTKDESQLTFKQMFMECMGYNKDDSLSNIELLQHLHTNCSYSFVMQHPTNHMVLSIPVPRIYLVAIYEINERVITCIPQPIYEGWTIFLDTKICFPEKYQCSTYEEYAHYFASLHTPREILGIMFTNLETGDRAALSNVVYENVKKLRGNNPNLQYQFFELKLLEDKQKFLKYFPMYTYNFFNFNQEYQQFINTVHQYYYIYYVLKQSRETPIPKKYFIHVSRIHHNIYIPSLSSDRVIITRKIVETYFENMSAGELMHYLYYEDKPKKVILPVEKLESNVEESVNESL
jgi:hypothetical protein